MTAIVTAVCLWGFLKGWVNKFIDNVRCRCIVDLPKLMSHRSFNPAGMPLFVNLPKLKRNQLCL
jgi:hypothetical protein